CERARSEMFFQKNMMPLDGDKSGFVVRNIIADFLGFATLGDILEVSTKIVKKRAASVIIEHQIYNQENKNIFNMEVLLIFVRDGKPSPIPKNLKDIFKEE
ncbi:MAG TPA: acyl-CoA thioesterase, partial [Campylobacterales bacterium]|nr:acyl-CoA thioesterase [Campylobacterales bacterium]